MATMEELAETIAALNEVQAAEVAGDSAEAVLSVPQPEQEAAPPPELIETAPEPEPEPPAPEPVGDEVAEKVPFRPVVQESKEFKELARRDRVARETSQKNDGLEKEVAALRAQVDGKQSQEDLRSQARDNPIEFMKKFGVSYDDITNTVLNDKPPAELAIQDDVAALRQELADLRKERATEAETQAKATEDASYNKFIDEIDNFVENNSTAFELIKVQGAHQLVGDVIRETYQATGRIMPYKEACGVVEEHLDKQVRVAMRTSKFAQKSEEQPIEVAPQAASPDIGATRPKTLTNQNTASPVQGNNGVDPNALLTRDESIAELAKLSFWAPN
jgi:hypothetical protein